MVEQRSVVRLLWYPLFPAVVVAGLLSFADHYSSGSQRIFADLLVHFIAGPALPILWFSYEYLYFLPDTVHQILFWSVNIDQIEGFVHGASGAGCVTYLTYLLYGCVIQGKHKVVLVVVAGILHLLALGYAILWVTLFPGA